MSGGDHHGACQGASSASTDPEGAARRLPRKIVKKGLSVREAEDLAGEIAEKGAAGRKPKLDPNLEAVQEDLAPSAGDQGRRSPETPKKGVIKIFYFSLDELNRIYELMKGVRS